MTKFISPPFDFQTAQKLGLSWARSWGFDESLGNDTVDGILVDVWMELKEGEPFGPGLFRRALYCRLTNEYKRMRTRRETPNERWALFYNARRRLHDRAVLPDEDRLEWAEEILACNLTLHELAYTCCLLTGMSRDAAAEACGIPRRTAHRMVTRMAWKMMRLRRE